MPGELLGEALGVEAAVEDELGLGAGAEGVEAGGVMEEEEEVSSKNAAGLGVGVGEIGRAHV